MKQDSHKARDHAVIKLVLFIPFTAFFAFLTIRDFVDGDIKGRSGLTSVSENPTGFYVGVILSACVALFGAFRVVMAVRDLTATTPNDEEEVW